MIYLPTEVGYRSWQPVSCRGAYGGADRLSRPMRALYVQLLSVLFVDRVVVGLIIIRPIVTETAHINIAI